MDPLTSSSTTSIDYDLFDRLNHTELYQLCRHAGLNVHPAWERTRLIDALRDWLPEDFSDVEHPIDELREGLIAFIEQYWRTLRPQLKCPAKDMKHPDPTKANPRPCFGCTDMQVIACVSNQAPQNTQLIKQLRKRS
jgi:hypothetical protein